MMPHFVVTKVDFALNTVRKPINGSNILVLGAAYKADIGDTRESPAIDVIRILRQKRAAVTVYDPHVPELRIDGEVVPIQTEPDETALREADLVLILTDHAAFPYNRIGEFADLIVDTRNVMKASGHESVQA